MLLNKTSCLCGKDLRDVRFDRYEPNFDKGFYGGRIDMYGYKTCECGRELKGYFSRNVNQSLNLFDLEVVKDITEAKKTDLKPTSFVDDSEETVYVDKNYEDMRYDELKAIAREKGIKGNIKREDLIKKLREAN